MSFPLRPSSPRDLAWAELGAELTPTKSLARVDTVTARVVTNVTVIGSLLTGLGVVAASLSTTSGLARALTVTAVIIASLAVASALIAQIMTVTRGINPANLVEVKAWYRYQFNTRAYATRTATILLLLAALLAGAAAVAALITTNDNVPTINVTQTLQQGTASTSLGANAASSTVTVQVTFRNLASDQITTVTIATPGTARVLASAAATPAPGGTAVINLTVSHITTTGPVIVIARAPNQSCRATLNLPVPSQPILTCNTTH